VAGRGSGTLPQRSETKNRVEAFLETLTGLEELF
jgi:hypothetical protein